jgi:elongation factor G
MLSEVEYTHKKQSGGAGQFAKVKLSVEPQEPGAKVDLLKVKLKVEQFQKNLFLVLKKELKQFQMSGILAGFPMIDYKVTILDGLHHDVDSSVLSF